MWSWLSFAVGLLLGLFLLFAYAALVVSGMAEHERVLERNLHRIDDGDL
jgi:hypothetical protein